MKIKEIMNKGIIAFEKNTPLETIAQTMKEQDIGMVLIKENKKIIGILTDRDIVTKILANNDKQIKEYFTKEIINIDQDEDVDKALDKMMKHKIKRLVVTDQKKVVGIVSLSDLIISKDDEAIGKAYKTIWQIHRNTDKYLSKIDEFEL